MFPPPTLPSSCSAVGPIAGPSSRAGPSLLFFLFTLSFSLSPSYTDRGRFQPSSRLPLMDRRLCRSGSRVRHRVDRVVGSQLRAPKPACWSNVICSMTSGFPWPRPSVCRSVRRATWVLQYFSGRWRNVPPLSSARLTQTLHRVDSARLFVNYSLSARAIARESSKYPVDRVFAEYRYVERRAASHFRSTVRTTRPRAFHGNSAVVPENSVEDDEDGGRVLLSSREDTRRTFGANTRKSKRRGHGSKSEFGYPRFALANGRANDADTSGHKASGNSSLFYLRLFTVNICIVWMLSTGLNKLSK